MRHSLGSQFPFRRESACDRKGFHRSVLGVTCILFQVPDDFPPVDICNITCSIFNNIYLSASISHCDKNKYFHISSTGISWQNHFWKMYLWDSFHWSYISYIRKLEPVIRFLSMGVADSKWYQVVSFSRTEKNNSSFVQLLKNDIVVIFWNTRGLHWIFEFICIILVGFLYPPVLTFYTLLIFCKWLNSPGAVRYTCNRYSIYFIKKITGSPSISLKMGRNSGLFQARAPYGIFRAPVHIQVYTVDLQ